MSLLDKAMSYAGGKYGTSVSDEGVELALAWARGDIGLGQCAHAWGVDGKPLSSAQTYLALAQNLREAVSSGRLTEAK